LWLSFHPRHRRLAAFQALTPYPSDSTGPSSIKSKLLRSRYRRWQSDVQRVADVPGPAALAVLSCRPTTRAYRCRAAFRRRRQLLRHLRLRDHATLVREPRPGRLPSPPSTPARPRLCRPDWCSVFVAASGLGARSHRRRPRADRDRRLALPRQRLPLPPGQRAYFVRQRRTEPAPATWTLGVEEAVLPLFPALLLLSWRVDDARSRSFGSPAPPAPVLTLAYATSLALSCRRSPRTRSGSAFYASPIRALEFGAARSSRSAAALRRIPFGLATRRRGRPRRLWVGLLVLERTWSAARPANRCSCRVSLLLGAAAVAASLVSRGLGARPRSGSATSPTTVPRGTGR